MRVKIQDLLTLLIGLFLFASCKDDSTIGLDLDPNTALQGNLVDTLTVRSKTLTEEPVETSSLVRYPLGYMNDPVFGKTEASLAFTVNAPKDNYSFGTQPTLDSVILVLPYSSQFYGDTATSVYSVDVFQLADDISRDKKFLSSRVYAGNGDAVGNRTGKIYPNTRFKVVDIVTDKNDTLKLVKPMMRIKLDNGFIYNSMVGFTDFWSSDQFVSNFKGLKVVVNKGKSSGNLGFMFFDFTTSESSLEVYYKRPNSTNASKVDTIKSIFPIGTNLSPVVASVSHDYTGTPVLTQLNNPGTTYPVTFLQGLSGIKNKISFPFLKKFRETAGNIVINKAELVVPVSAGTNVAPYLAPLRLGLYSYDIAAQRQNITDRTFFTNQYQSPAAGDAAFGGYFDSIKNQFVFVITSYIQSIYDGKDEDYGTYLNVTPLTEFAYTTPSLTTAARATIGSGDKDASGAYINPNNRLKLNIYYTKIN